MENSISVMKLLQKTYKGYSYLYWAKLLTVAFVLGFGLAKAAVETMSHFYKPAKKAVSMSPKQVLTKVYITANRHFQGDSSARLEAVRGHFGKHLTNAFNQHDGLLTYTLARETRNGKLKRFDVLSEQITAEDSAIVKARSTFQNDSTKTFDQQFIREGGEWKFALTYGHHVR